MTIFVFCTSEKSQLFIHNHDAVVSVALHAVAEGSMPGVSITNSTVHMYETDG